MLKKSASAFPFIRCNKNYYIGKNRASFLPDFLFFLHKLLELLEERIYVLELAVDRGESDVRYLVVLLELEHNELTDLLCGYLGLHRVLYLLLDLADDLIGIDGALLARLHNSAEYLIAVKKLFFAVLLYYELLNGFNSFKRGKPFLTFKAFPSAADAVTVGRGS